MKKKIIYLCVAIEVNDDEVHQQKEIDRNIQSILDIKVYDNVDKRSVAPLSAGVMTSGNSIERLFDLKKSVFEHQEKLGMTGTAHITGKVLNVVQSVIEESPFKPLMISQYERIFGPH